MLDHRGHFIGSSRYPIIQEDADGHVGYVDGYIRGLGDYLRTALPLGFVVRRCEETYRGDIVDEDDLPEPITPGPPDIWELHPWIRDAANAAKSGHPAAVAWDFEFQPG